MFDTNGRLLYNHLMKTLRPAGNRSAPGPIRGKILRRGRLLEMLRANLDRKLTIICAAAGYGKTTILTQFCQELKSPFVFCPLDAGDSDVRSFFNRLISEMRKHVPGFGAKVGAVIAEKRSNETVAGTFINEFIECVRDEFYIIFDDYHRLRDDREIARVVNYILRHLPANLHVVIASRTTPPLYLSYYLAKQELLHLDKEHLQFDIAETRSLMRDVYDLSVHEDEVTRIAELSEGWATVIQLIMQKMSATPGARAEDTLNGFIASGEGVFEYFTREVFGAQIKAVREFLVRTSILEYLNPEVCDHVLGRRGSRAMIDHLETAHLFVLRAGENLVYHPLFQEFLHRTLVDSASAHEVRRLHDAASAHFVTHEDYSSAVLHLLSAGRYDRAAKILENHREHWLSSDRNARFIRLVERIPEPCMEKHPRLRLEKAGMHIESGHVEKGLVDIDKAFKRMRARGDRRGMFEAYRMKSITGTLLMRPSRTLYYIKKAYALCGKTRSREKTAVLIALGTAYRVLGRFSKAETVLRDALAHARALKDDTLECRALNMIAMLYYNMSRLKEAESIFADIVKRFHDQMCDLDRAYTYRIIASIAVDNGNGVRATQYIGRSEAIALQYGDRYINNFLLLLKARVRFMQGDNEGAAGLFRQTIEQNRGGDIKITDLYALLELVEVHLETGDTRSARAALDEAASVMKSGNEVPQHTVGYLIAKGMVETAEGNLNAAQASLDRALRMSKKVYDPMQDLAIHYALSGRAMACEETVKAFDHFKKCLETAVRHGLEAYLAWRGRRDLRLFKVALEHEQLASTVLSIMERMNSPEAQEIVRGYSLEQGRFDFECSFLGSLRIRDARGRSVEPRWRTVRTRALFVLLAMNHPQGCSKEMLMEACWPKRSPDQAGRSLQVEMSSLRRLLSRMAGSRFRNENLVVYRDHMYALNRRFCIDRDISRFEKAVHEAMVKERTDRNECIRLLNEARSMYRGDFCEELSEDWFSSARAYYREMALDVAKKLARYAYEDGDVEKALLLYRDAQRFDPYDESLHVGIMRCLVLMKDNSGVQRQYRILKKTLRELNVQCAPREAVEMYENSVK